MHRKQVPGVKSRMQKYVRRTAAVTGLVLLASLSGCMKVGYEPKISSLYVDTDGTVKGAEVTSFDNSAFAEERYKEEDLKTFVEEAVIAYNREVGSPAKAYSSELEEKNTILPVSINTLEVAEGTATLILDYASCEDYTRFNEADTTITELSLMTAPDALAAGAPLNELYDAEGDLIDTSREQTKKRYLVLTVAGTLPVVVNGNILGVSQGVTILDDHTINVTAGTTGYVLLR